MLSTNTVPSEDDIEAAGSLLEDCSPELVAACAPDYSPQTIVALLGRWDPGFAATVRQSLDLDGWVHVIDGIEDVNRGVAWLLSDAELSMSKKVVDRIGQLDRARGQGWTRAANLMKGLRLGRTLPSNTGANVANSTNSIQTPAPQISGTTAPLTNHGLVTPSAAPFPPSIIVSNALPEEVQPPDPGPTVVPTPTPALLKVPSPRDVLTGTQSHPTDRDSPLSKHLPPSTSPTTPHLPTPAQSPGPAVSPLPSSASSLRSPAGLEGLNSQDSTAPVLPSGGTGKNEHEVMPNARVLAEAGPLLFSRTPLHQSMSGNLASRSKENPPTDSSGPTQMSATSRTPQAPPLALISPGPPSPSADTLQTPLIQPPPVPHTPPAIVEVEVVVDRLSIEEKSKYTRMPKPSMRRSPTPAQEDESSLGSDNDYKPDSSSSWQPTSDDEGEDGSNGEGDSDLEFGESGQSEDEGNEEDQDDGEDEEPDEEDGDEDDEEGEDDEDDDSPIVGRSGKARRGDEEIAPVKVSTAWTWSKEENDRRVRKWKLEKAIDDKPTALHPVRTQWMYEARLKDKSEADYEDVLRSEHKELLTVPPAPRSVVGKMYLQRAKGDWEVRVVLTCLTWRYTKVKMKKEDAMAKGDREAAGAFSAEMTKILNTGMKDLFERFPDLDPDHKKRQIGKKLGSNAVTAYVQALRSKVSSDAGRMSNACHESGGTLGILESNSAGRKSLGILDILGKKRKDVAFHLWGGSSSGGRDQCDKLIEEKMEKWKRLNPFKTSREISNQALLVVCEVRRQLFGGLPAKVQQSWEDKAKNLHLPQSDEERQCLVDAVLPYIYRLLSHLSEHTTLHFVLLASGQGTSNVPVLIHEFSKSNADKAELFSEHAPLAQRIRSDYLQYAIDRHNTGQEEVVEGLPVLHTPDEVVADSPDNEVLVESKGSSPGNTPIKPFKPDLTAVKTRSQKIAYTTRWFMQAAEQILGYKPGWDVLSKNMPKYVAANRLPADPLVQGKALEIVKPTSMADERFDVLWKHLLDSYSGALSPETRFAFRVELLHLNLPSAPAPGDPSVHQAAINATKTLPVKTKATAKGQNKARTAKGQAAVQPLEDLLDGPGLGEDVDAAALETALENRTLTVPRAKRSSRNVLRITSPDIPETLHANAAALGGEALAQTMPKSTGGGNPGAATVATVTAELDVVTALKADGAVAVGTIEAPDEVSRMEAAEPRVKQYHRPRPRGILPTAKDSLSHPSFPWNDGLIRQRWCKTLEELRAWGQKMGCGFPHGKVLRFKGTIKNQWASLMPTGLDSTFCIAQIWAAYQNDTARLPPISIPKMAGLQDVSPDHPVAIAIDVILDPELSLPSAKLFNMQFGASQDANDGFFDFLEGTLADLIARSLQSEDVLLDGDINLLQALRLATLVGGSGFIRDYSASSEHTERVTGLADRLNIFLASLALVRYHHVVLGGVASAFCHDEDLPAAQKEMWEDFRNVWTLAVRTMARAVIELRNDLFDWDHLSQVLPAPLGSLLQSSIALRPWWIHGVDGQPTPVSFTTKQSLATSTFWDTVSKLHWSSLSLLERSQYLLLVFLATIQIHSRRVPAPLEGFTLQSDQPTPDIIQAMRAYLSKLKVEIADSTEQGSFDLPLEDRRQQPNVIRCIERWKSESQHPAAIIVNKSGERIGSEHEPRKPEDVSSLQAESPPRAPAGANFNEPLQPGGPQEPRTAALVSDSSPHIHPGQRGVSAVPPPLPPPREIATTQPEPPNSLPSPSPANDNVSGASTESQVPLEEEDPIWSRDAAMDVDGAELEEGLNSQSGGGPPAPGPSTPLRVVPAVHSRPSSPTEGPKAKRPRLMETPSYWRLPEVETDGRRLRSSRPQVANTPGLPTTNAAQPVTQRGRGKNLAVITETQAAMTANSSGQRAITKRKPQVPPRAAQGRGTRGKSN